MAEKTHDHQYHIHYEDGTAVYLNTNDHHDSFDDLQTWYDKHKKLIEKVATGIAAIAIVTVVGNVTLWKK